MKGSSFSLLVNYVSTKVISRLNNILPMQLFDIVFDEKLIDSEIW